MPLTVLLQRCVRKRVKTPGACVGCYLLVPNVSVEGRKPRPEARKLVRRERRNLLFDVLDLSHGEFYQLVQGVH